MDNRRFRAEDRLSGEALAEWRRYFAADLDCDMLIDYVQADQPRRRTILSRDKSWILWIAIFLIGFHNLYLYKYLYDQ